MTTAVLVLAFVFVAGWLAGSGYTMWKVARQHRAETYDPHNHDEHEENSV